MAQLNEFIKQAQDIIAIAEKLKANPNREDSLKLHCLTTELSTKALNIALNSI